MIYALGNFVPFLFWGISLLQIASDLFNSINYQHLQKYCARYGESLGSLELQSVFDLAKIASYKMPTLCIY